MRPKVVNDAPEHGPLPGLLLALTVVTGIVDAVSYLRLGHVFVANTTGNIVFLGFAAAGALDLSAGASLAAIAAFLIGSLLGGRLGVALGGHRGRLLASAVAIETAVVAVAAVTAHVLDVHQAAVTYALIVALAVTMGVQNATARRISVPDWTTTVLTMTLTGLAADSPLAGGKGTRAGRRVLSVLAMLAGAFAGGTLAIHVGIAAALALAVVLLGGTAFAVHRLSAAPAAWTAPLA